NRVEPLLRAGLEADDQYRLRVRGAHQAPAVAELDACAVDVDHLVGRGEFLLERLDDRELAVVRTAEPRLRSGEVVRDGIDQVRERLVGRGDVAEQTAGGEQG